MDQDVLLGKIIEGERPGRDAIHIAVVAVTSAQSLSPGEPVELVPGSQDVVRAVRKGGVGIVDPFLPGQVDPGERFWVCLYPYTITSLRHTWMHPAFEPENQSPTWLESKGWLTKFGEDLGIYDHPPVSYEDVVASALETLNSDWKGSDVDFPGMSGGPQGSLPDEFWDHIAVVTGRSIPQEKRGGVYCAC